MALACPVERWFSHSDWFAFWFKAGVTLNVIAVSSGGFRIRRHWRAFLLYDPSTWQLLGILSLITSPLVSNCGSNWRLEQVCLLVKSWRDQTSSDSPTITYQNGRQFALTTHGHSRIVCQISVRFLQHRFSSLTKTRLSTDPWNDLKSKINQAVSELRCLKVRHRSCNNDLLYGSWT